MRIGKKQTVIIGPPGCGKTTKCLELMEHHLKMGVDPERIAFVSFTKAAVEVAKKRAKQRFGFSVKRLPWFRTLHSLAFKKIGWTVNDVIQDKHYEELARLLGSCGSINTKCQQGDDKHGIFFGAASIADVGLYLDSKARGMMLDWLTLYNREAPMIERKRLRYVVENYRHYKKQRGVKDFTSMLEEFIEQGEPLDVDVVFIDEAQDLNLLQWHVACLAFANAEQVYIAGDDDQAIYKWSGADVEMFQNLEGERMVLDQSHRLPVRVHRACMHVIDQVKNRIPKEFKPKAEVGVFKAHRKIEHLFQDDLRQGEWLILSRNKDIFKYIRKLLRLYGHVYVNENNFKSTLSYHQVGIRAWVKLQKGGVCTHEELNDLYKCLKYGQDYEHNTRMFVSGEEYDYNDLVRYRGLIAPSAEPWYDCLNGIKEESRIYYRNIIRRNGGKWEEPRIRLSSIHAAKGSECDNVLLLCDMSKESHNDLMKNPDDEHRVFYVGMSRAKQNLHVMFSRLKTSSYVPRYYPFDDIFYAFPKN